MWLNLTSSDVNSFSGVKISFHPYWWKKKEREKPQTTRICKHLSADLTFRIPYGIGYKVLIRNNTSALLKQLSQKLSLINISDILNYNKVRYWIKDIKNPKNLKSFHEHRITKQFTLSHWHTFHWLRILFFIHSWNFNIIRLFHHTEKEKHCIRYSVNIWLITKRSIKEQC